MLLAIIYPYANNTNYAFIICTKCAVHALWDCLSCFGCKHMRTNFNTFQRVRVLRPCRLHCDSLLRLLSYRCRCVSFGRYFRYEFVDIIFLLRIRHYLDHIILFCVCVWIFSKLNVYCRSKWQKWTQAGMQDHIIDNIISKMNLRLWYNHANKSYVPHGAHRSAHVQDKSYTEYTDIHARIKSYKLTCLAPFEYTRKAHTDTHTHTTSTKMCRRRSSGVKTIVHAHTHRNKRIRNNHNTYV